MLGREGGVGPVSLLVKERRRRPVGRGGVRRRRQRQPLLSGPQSGVHEGRVGRPVPRLRVGVGHDRSGWETRGPNEELSGDSRGSVSGSGHLRNHGQLRFYSLRRQCRHMVRQISDIDIRRQTFLINIF